MNADNKPVAVDARFADALAAVMALPLTDAEKADAVRRLLRPSAAETEGGGK